MNAKQLQQEVIRLTALVGELKATASKPRTLTYKVSVKGGMSVYGLNARFPVTLYKEQWKRLLGIEGELHAFLDDPANIFSDKDNPVPLEPTTSRQAAAIAELMASETHDGGELSKSDIMAMLAAQADG